MEKKEELWQRRLGLFIVRQRRRVTGGARSTLTDGAESITRTLSKELRGNIISQVSKASRKQLNNSIVDSREQSPGPFIKR